MRAAYRAGCKILGTSPEDVEKEPKIGTYIKEQLGLDAWVAVDYVRMSSHPDAEKFLSAYDTPELCKRHRNVLPLEAYCCAAKISALTLMEMVVAVLVRVGAQKSAVVAATRHAEVVEKTVEVALTDDGHRDRMMLHKATGFMPSPKGSQTTIQVNQSQNQAQQASAPAVLSAPPPEQTIRRLTDRFNESRGQLPTVATEVLEAEDDEDDEDED